ncbi:MAG: RICIN domain-containing protein [Desulfobacteraceae bacterium]
MKKITLIISMFMLIGAFTLEAQDPTEMPEGKFFYIRSVMDSGNGNLGFWDVPGTMAPNPEPSERKIQRGKNIQVYARDNGHDRKFLFHSASDGFYEIQVGLSNNSRIDIDNAGTENGTNVKVWDRNGSQAQQFKFHHLGNGRFKIYDRNGKILCLAGRSNNNRSNVHIWEDHGGDWTEWYLYDVATKQAFVPEASKPKADFKSWIKLEKVTTIERYLEDVSASQLINDDKGTIKRAVSDLSNSDQVSMVPTLMDAVLENDDKKGNCPHHRHRS